MKLKYNVEIEIENEDVSEIKKIKKVMVDYLLENFIIDEGNHSELDDNRHFKLKLKTYYNDWNRDKIYVLNFLEKVNKKLEAKHKIKGLYLPRIHHGEEEKK